MNDFSIYSQPKWAYYFTRDFLRFGHKTSPDGNVLRPYQKNVLKAVKYDCVAQKIAIVKARQLGITYMLAMLGVAWGMCHKNHSINVISLKKDQAEIVTDYAKELIHRNPLLVKLTNPPYAEKKASAKKIYFSTGSIMKAHPLRIPKGDNIRGIASHLTIIDEAAFMPNDAFDAILPTVQSTKGLTVASSTPGYTRGALFYNMFYNEQSGYETFKMMGSELYTPEELEAKRQELINKPGAFEREYLCQWEVELGEMYPVEILKANFKPNIHCDGPMGRGVRFAGVDIGVTKCSSVYSVIEQDRTRNVYVIHHYVFPKNTPLRDVADYTKRMNKKYKVFKTYVDAMGPGAMVYQELRGKIVVEAVHWNAKEKTTDFSRLRKLLHEDTIFIDNTNIRLRKELEGIQYKMLRSGGYTFSSTFPTMDCVCSLAMSLRGILIGLM